MFRVGPVEMKMPLSKLLVVSLFLGLALQEQIPLECPRGSWAESHFT